MNEEACNRFKKADAELNRVYQSITDTPPVSAEFRMDRTRQAGSVD
jgi:hypothetical protein